MTTIARLTPSAALEAFRGWIVLALPTLTEVVLAKQSIADAPRGALPYATVERTRVEHLATPHRRVGDAAAAPGGTEGEQDYDLEITQVEDLIVELKIYGDTGPDMLDKLSMAKGRLDSQEYLETQGVAVREIADALNLRELRDTAHEASALQEYAITFTAEDVSTVGTIEEAAVLGYPDMPTV